MSSLTKELTLVDILAKIGKWFYILLFLFMTVVPIIWLTISSFKTNFEFETQPFSLPSVWQFQNYAKAIQMGGLPRLFLNSVIVAVSTTGLNILVSAMGAFAISREKFRFNEALLNVILAGVLIPIIALMVPYFKIVSTLGIYDSLPGLILTYAAINIPISVFLIHGFMGSIPIELEEAAVIDGCSFAQRFTKIVFPLTKPGLVTAGTFMFIYCWNEFTYAMLLTSSESSRTLQLGIRFFKSQFVTDYTSMLAAIVITMLPTIIVYIFLHDRIISGMTSGAVKG
ncbi:MAG: carbohydrate ABC transporter permease [Spirochaetia bacterium]|jgi:raffinose/stachyose/melibiose transport system permease protein|nr:carbohydrate ABC transporter permease [Spirochaetia bacterium]MCF7941558.1 carbohydrate ABC transporter permease [Spirochaetia bacterium]